MVNLTIDGKKKTSTGKGVGPVDAASHAIRTMIDPSIQLKEYSLKAITGGTDRTAGQRINQIQLFSVNQGISASLANSDGSEVAGGP